jgi:2-polyprenyl-3-methyl-5-hydroxy-6-metoxy-1,4-benzoquinol methylase
VQRCDSDAEFKERISPELLPEMIDAGISYEALRACFQDLEEVNRWSLGYRPTFAWLRQLLQSGLSPVRIVDVGSGGGDLLRQIASWAKKHNLPVHLTGIDMNAHAVQAAKEFTPQELGITWLTGDALLYQPEEQVDIIVSSLMTHHLEDCEVVSLLQWMETTARVGWFINDLERSPWSCRVFGWVASTMRWHPYVKHDGLVSFRRAFREEDWVRLLAEANIRQVDVTLESWRPGRLCVGRWRRSESNAGDDYESRARP